MCRSKAECKGAEESTFHAAGQYCLMPCLPDMQVKMHWVHENYWQPGPQGNDIQKTNVPNLRMRFRYDNHQEEVHTLA